MNQEDFQLLFPFYTDKVKDQFNKITTTFMMLDKINYKNKSINNRQFYFQRMLITLLFPESKDIKELYPDDNWESTRRQELMWHCGVWLTKDNSALILNPVIVSHLMSIHENDLLMNLFKSDFETIDISLKNQIINSTWFKLYRGILDDKYFQILQVYNIPYNFQSLMKNVFTKGRRRTDILDNLYEKMCEIQPNQIKLNMHEWAIFGRNKFNSHTVFTQQYLHRFLPEYEPKEGYEIRIFEIKGIHDQPHNRVYIKRNPMLGLDYYE